MLENIRCDLCKHFASSKIIKRQEREEDEQSEKKKKRKRKKKSYDSERICSITGDKIREDTQACKFLNPVEFVSCDEHNCTIHILNCLNRRMNNKGFKTWESCTTKCRQFTKGISDIINDYYVNGKEIAKPRRKITRRNPKESPKENPKKKRVITRRNKHNEQKKKRVITRRKPKQDNDFDKLVKRIIKRRKEKRKITRR